MKDSRSVRLVLITMIALIAALVPVLPASSQEEWRCFPTPTGDYCPAGVACEFPLQADYSNMRLSYHEFYDKEGNFKGMIAAGKGYVLTLTNLDTGATLSQEVNGTFFRDQIGRDGIERVSASGNFFMIIYPLDQPPGPSARMYTGQAVFRFDATTGASILEHLSGQSVDMCAALSD